MGIVSGGFHYNIIINDCCCYDLDTSSSFLDDSLYNNNVVINVHRCVQLYAKYYSIIFPSFRVSKFIDSEIEEIIIVLIVSYR